MRAVLAGVLMLVGGCDRLVSPSRYTEVVVEAVRRDGTPVPGVRATLYTGQRTMGHATTDAAGRAVFTFVPEGPAYGVFVQEPDGYELPETIFGGPPTNVAAGFAVVRDSVHVVRFTLLQRGTGTIEVDVADDGGMAIAGQVVTLYSPTATVGDAVTGADGRAQFTGVPFGVYGVQTRPPAGYGDSSDPPIVFRDGLFVEEGSVVGVQFVFTRCRGTLDVFVVDPAVGPAPGLLVTLYDARTVRDSLRTSDAGRGSFLTGCGEVGVLVSPGAQWTPVPGRGGEYVDGITVRRGTTAMATLLVRRNP